MKKHFLNIFILLITITTMAQTTSPSISVNGSTTHTIKPTFNAKMILSLNNVYYDAPGTTFPELKESYLATLEKNGIDLKALKEDKFAYELLRYEKEGTYFEFKTTSIETLEKFISVKAFGVSQSDSSFEYTLTDDEIAMYAKEAYDNAKAKAEAIAKKIDRKVGKAIYIHDNNLNKISESLYYGSDFSKRDYQISVSFELL
ncbi:SIMPL domain-containing protein [Cellulophaga sp. HaHaR_3_176]|uniref:SIMPL domain-containing protein n=1 Tax=Cellulophaga sp. HaHaR_3_176 TaxID=1942464 RepID=UPI001C1FB4FD|nr:SIMPL domain-containing protein [Cellulophaga sp. HaHaR_3_176]QWX84190.1 SIMPL domain-containing protein [Cellulophaga sp. HaHaR_3_176]